MDTSAYDRGLKCLNPHCKSFGRVHPNCRCHPLAGGGAVEPFCSGAKEHKADCEYYMAEGGDTTSYDDLGPVQEKTDGTNYDDLGPETKGAQSGGEDETNYDDLVPAKQEQPIEKPAGPGKYAGPIEGLKTRMEGFAEGAAPGLAPWAETRLLGVDPEDIKGRAEAHPIEHGISKAVGTVASVVGGPLSYVGKAAGLASRGSVALKGALEGLAYYGGDKATDAILNKPGSDPNILSANSLLHAGGAALVGGLASPALELGAGMIGKGLANAENSKIAQKMTELLERIGKSGKPLNELGLDTVAGYKKEALAWGAGAIGGAHAGPVGAAGAYMAAKKALDPIFEKIIGTGNEYTTDAINRCLMENNPDAVPNVIHFIKNVGRGMKETANAVNSVFAPGYEQISKPISDKAIESFKGWVEGGQVDKQMETALHQQQGVPGFAEGGMVSSPDDRFGRAMPEQSIILNAAKGRIAGYLNSIRPLPNQPKLPFDKPAPQTEKARSYEKAVRLAISPMSIMDKVNRGDLTPEMMTHFKSLYPEVHEHLSKELTKKITESQLSGEAPPYKKRQALSLFLGTDLDSTLSPQSIATIQGLYAAKSAQQQVPQKTKKGTAPLSKAPNQFLTSEQSREQRQQNAKS